MMEGESKTAYSCEKQKSFFFQLRHLAGEVDNKVHFVKEQLVSRSCKLEPCQDQASANLFLMNTKRELSSTFEQVKTKYNVFDSCSNDFHRIQELLKSVLCAHEKRVGKMQDFMECYGYVKPVIEPSILTALKGSQPESHKEDIESSQSDDDEDEDNIEESVSGTPQAKANMEAKDKMEKLLIKTPKLEDLYGKLSENTLFLLKGATSNDADLNTMQLSNYSLSSVQNKTYSTPFDSQKAEGKFGFNATSTCKERTDNANNFITNLQTNTECKPETMPTGKDHVFQITQSLSNMSEKYANHGSSFRTPDSMIKSKEQKKTPVFEDVYGMLSECTISLLRNTSHKSVSAEKLLTSVLDSPKDIPVLSEQSVLLKPNDKSLSESSLQNCSQWTISSPKDCSITNATSQSIQTTVPIETSTCGDSYNSTDEIKVSKCARTLLYTQPPVSENTIRFTTSYRQMASAGKENVPAVSLFDSMPASPKLLSSALIQDIYNNKY
nr:hypothetical protein BgiMline_017653 [Biomphalaria glabrata]